MRASLRPATPDDKEFLWNLHRDTMREYVEQVWGWDEAWQRERFLERFDPDERRIVELDGVSVGAIQVDRQADHIFLKNLHITPSHQNRGIGARLITSLIEEDVEKKVSLRLQVLKVNPSRRLYDRLGFRETVATETHIILEHLSGCVSD